MTHPDPATLADYLRRAMVARIATISRTGRPHVNPLYFVCDGGRLYLGTRDRTLAALNVRANPRVTILLSIESGSSDSRNLRITGDATVRHDPELLRWYLRRDLRKYILTRRGLVNVFTHARLLLPMRSYFSAEAKGKRCVIEVLSTEAELLATP